MRYRTLLAGLLSLLTPWSTARAQHHGWHHCGRGGFGHVSSIPGAGGGVSSWNGYSVSYYGTVGLNGPEFFMPPLVVVAPGSLLGPLFMPPPALPAVDRGRLLAGPMPGPGMAGLNPLPAAARPKRNDAARSNQLVTVGDRLFRAGNYHRAAERYEQAAKADPSAAAPRIRLSQIALVRGQFAEAANQIREALTVEPGWLIAAPDIQAIYGEPGDFAKQIAKLEAHLHASPADRDAWLVLGAQLFLSGRTRKAADIFLRLSDRKPDPTLAAFLAVTAPRDAEQR